MGGGGGGSQHYAVPSLTLVGTGTGTALMQAPADTVSCRLFLLCTARVVLPDGRQLAATYTEELKSAKNDKRSYEAAVSDFIMLLFSHLSHFSYFLDGTWIIIG